MSKLKPKDFVKFIDADGEHTAKVLSVREHKILEDGKPVDVVAVDLKAFINGTSTKVRGCVEGTDPGCWRVLADGEEV